LTVPSAASLFLSACETSTGVLFQKSGNFRFSAFGASLKAMSCAMVAFVIFACASLCGKISER
jgi:hypothetical protein